MNKRTNINPNKPKAFLGAIIGAVAGTAGSLIQAQQQKKAQQKVAREAATAAATQEAIGMNQQLAQSDEARRAFMEQFRPSYKSGGGIHIKPENRGKFTAAAKRRGMGVQEFASKVMANKENYSPTLVKRANFARNAAKWKHAAGGTVAIKNGGKAEAIGNNAFLLRGAKHSQGGIDVKVGKKVIEAEGGEVMKVEADKVKILSAQPMLSGTSPAEVSLANPNNVDVAFNAQENVKARKGLNNDGTKKKAQTGGAWNRDEWGRTTYIPSLTTPTPATTPVASATTVPASTGGSPQATRASFNWGSAIPSLVSAAGSMASGLIGLHAVNRTPAPRRPIGVQAAKLKTTFNVQPQLANIERQEGATREAIRQGTASSNVALARQQVASTSATGQRNVVLGQKENIETQLINQDALNRQQVAASNVGALNQWRDNQTQFEGARIAARSNAFNMMIRGASDAVSDIATRQEKEETERKTLAVVAAGDVNNNLGRMIEMDYFNPNKRQDRQFLMNTYSTSNNEEMRKMIANKLNITYTRR